jgi:hypothetical protein
MAAPTNNATLQRHRVTRPLIAKFVGRPNDPFLASSMLLRNCAVFEMSEALLETQVLFFEFDHMQGEFFHLREQFRLQIAHANAVPLHFFRARNSGQMVIRIHIRRNFPQRRETIAGIEDIVRTRCGNNHLFCADCSGHV